MAACSQIQRGETVIIMSLKKKSEEAARNTLLSPSAHVGGCIGWDPADMLYYGRRERGPPSCVDGA